MHLERLGQAVPSLESACVAAMASVLARQADSLPGVLESAPFAASQAHALWELKRRAAEATRVPHVRPWFLTACVVQLELCFVTDRQLEELTPTHFPALRDLRLHDCPRLSSDALDKCSLPSTLAILRVSACPLITSASIGSAARGCAELHVSGCPKADLFAPGALFHRAKLHVRGPIHPRSPVQLPDMAPQLVELCLVNLPNLDDAAVEQIVQRAPGLTHVDLCSTSVSLLGVKLLLHALVRLTYCDVSDCRVDFNSATPDEIWECFAGHVPTLRTLKLNRARNLHRDAAFALANSLQVVELELQDCLLADQHGTAFERLFWHCPGLVLCLAENPNITGQFFEPLLRNAWHVSTLNLAGTGFADFATTSWMEFAHAMADMETLVLDRTPVRGRLAEELLLFLTSAQFPMAHLSLSGCQGVSSANLVTDQSRASPKPFRVNVEGSRVSSQSTANTFRELYPNATLITSTLPARPSQHHHALEEADASDASEHDDEEVLESFVRGLEHALGEDEFYSSSPQPDVPDRHQHIQRHDAAFVQQLSHACCRCMVCARLNAHISSDKIRFSRQQLLELRTGLQSPCQRRRRQPAEED
jgi:hypothetical protein